MLKKKFAKAIKSNLHCFIFRVTVSSCGNQWESNAFTFLFKRYGKAFFICAAKKFLFSVFTVFPDGSDSMDNIFAWKLISFCNFGFPGFTFSESDTFRKQTDSCCTVNCAVNTSATAKTVICGVYYGIAFHFCNIVSYKQKRH